MSDESGPVLLTGWGGTSPTAARVARAVTPTGAEQLLRRATAEPGGRGLIARGLGRSYGDAAQNAGGVVLETHQLDRVVTFDRATGLVTAQAGLSLDALMRHVLPSGWFVPVTPGTRFVSLGGAFAADIHGKNHHFAGSFAQHVTSLDLLTPDGTVRRLTPEADQTLFWASAGGMGLTGVILQLTVQLRPVETSAMLVDTTRADNLDALMSALVAADSVSPYSVAWVDGTATGPRLGRGIVTAGDHARVAALPGGRDPLAFAPRQRLSAPPWMPAHLVNRASARAFNEAWFRKAPRTRVGEIQSIEAFFHPLDGVAGWNRVYGHRGFVQHQLVVPFEAGDVLRRVLSRLTAGGAPTFLGVLKRFGAADPGFLSFPRPGWTLAVDIPAEVSGLGELLDELDREVAIAGGSVYLAKDGRLDPALLATFYPRVEEFRALRADLDPLGAITSDLSRRLSL